LYFPILETTSTILENKISANNIIITKLTALWALNESGLGGMMFALHIPLTGFFVGGFAIILIGLIAFYSDNNFKQIIKATVLVLIIKAMASPHAPPPAYLAVAFQGVTGAVLFNCIRNYKFAAILLAVLAMAESSLQKIIVMTLIYGKSIWIALDKSVEGISKDFSIHTTVNFSYWVIGTYVLIHVVWGILIGIFTGRLPHLINKHTPVILDKYQTNKSSYTVDQQLSTQKKNKNTRWLSFVLILLFVVIVFLMSGTYADYKILYVIIRSVAAVLLLFFVLRPLMTLAIQYWLKKQRTATKQEAVEIMAMMPGIRNFVKPSWQMAKSNPENMGRLRYFILSMIILTLHHE
jgi:hypothetical protein